MGDEVTRPAFPSPSSPTSRLPLPLCLPPARPRAARWHRAPDPRVAPQVEGLAGAESTSDILRSKLESVLQETRTKQAKDVTELDVRGERVPIKSEKTRVAVRQCVGGEGGGG